MVKIWNMVGRNIMNMYFQKILRNNLTLNYYKWLINGAKNKKQIMLLNSVKIIFKKYKLRIKKFKIKNLNFYNIFLKNSYTDQQIAQAGVL